MKGPIIIGLKEFKFKKDAITYYRTILNSYDFGQSLNESDYDDLYNLYSYANISNEVTIDNIEENIAGQIEYTETNELSGEDLLIVKDIKVSKVQFNTKCFEFFLSDNTSFYISYLMIINNQKYDPAKMFNIACRNSIHKDIRKVKQDYFDANSIKGQVKCQETGKLSKWEDLVVDHRQPNTFSIIVDRFKEVNKIDLDEIEYASSEENHLVFKDDSLSQRFVLYHKEKANLRIVRKECNSSRSGMARIKRSPKDLTIK